MNDYLTPFTHKNICLNLVLSGVVIGGGILVERYMTRKAEKELAEMHAKTDETIKSIMAPLT